MISQTTSLTFALNIYMHILGRNEKKIGKIWKFRTIYITLQPNL